MFCLPLILLNPDMQDIDALEENCRLMIAYCILQQASHNVCQASLMLHWNSENLPPLNLLLGLGPRYLYTHGFCVCVCVYRRTGTVVFCAVEKPFLLE